MQNFFFDKLRKFKIDKDKRKIRFIFFKSNLSDQSEIFLSNFDQKVLAMELGHLTDKPIGFDNLAIDRQAILLDHALGLASCFAKATLGDEPGIGEVFVAR